MYYMIHHKFMIQTFERIEQAVLAQKEEDSKSYNKKAGRPKTYALQLPKSLGKDISLNTAA